MHTSNRTNDRRCFFLRTTSQRGDETRRGGGCVFVCNNGGGATAWLRTPDPNPTYSTTPVLPALIIQSLEENIIHPHPPSHDGLNESEFCLAIGCTRCTSARSSFLITSVFCSKYSPFFFVRIIALEAFLSQILAQSIFTLKI